jgi:putative tryptophan/tyrosine transport system substrate-binding protein
MSPSMDRRRFLLTSLAGALAAPLATGAQQAAKISRIAMLVPGPSTCPETSTTRVLRRGLAEAGYTEDRDFILDRRCFPTDDTAAAVAADLLKQRPTVFVAGGHTAAITVRNLATVPVVFAAIDDPVASGLVRSLAQPGTNMTGVTDITTQLYPKRVEILKQALPTLRRVATLEAPVGYSMRGVRADIDSAATALAIQLSHFTVRTAAEIMSAFETMKRNGVEALIVMQSPLTWSERTRIIDLALMYRLPAIYPWPEPATEKGGLIAFGADQAALWGEAARYVAKILRGSKPADLPVAQPTKYQLVINLKTAKALGLTIPPSLLARADQVIE